MEDFGYQRDGENSTASDLTKRAFLVGATLFSIAAFIYITINAYYYVYQDKNADIETIKSPEGPIKVVEEDSTSAGDNAVQINRSIYEDIFGNKKEALKIQNTKIKNAPEPALPPKVVVKESAPSVAITPPTNTTTPANNPTPEQKIIVYSGDKKPAQPSKDLLTKTDGSVKTTPTKAAASEKKRAVRVQVAAMTSENAAEENWKRLNRLFPNLFSGLKPFTQKVDLGKRGIFYRLQIGDFFNQIEAEEFCNRYVAQAQKSRADCIVVE